MYPLLLLLCNEKNEYPLLAFVNRTNNSCKQQLLFAKINPVIYFSQSHLLLTKANEDRTTSRKALFSRSDKQQDDFSFCLA